MTTMLSEVKAIRRLYANNHSPNVLPQIIENPTRINNPFWNYMIESGEDPFHIRNKIGFKYGRTNRPIFTFGERFGRTITKLSDSRIVFIGGEHEDCYDPDFFIYNDVVVAFDLNNVTFNTDEPKLKKEQLPRKFEIYSYPSWVFPPTDFHTATLVENLEGRSFIYIIGGSGFEDSEHRKQTLTRRLCIKTMEMEVIETKGVMVPPLNNNLYRLKATWSAKTETDQKITIVAKTRLDYGETGINKIHECEYTLDLIQSVWTLVYDKIMDVEREQEDKRGISKIETIRIMKRKYDEGNSNPNFIFKRGPQLHPPQPRFSYPLYLVAEMVETPELIQLVLTNRELYHLIVWDNHLWRKAALRFTGNDERSGQPQLSKVTTQYDVLFQYMMKSSKRPSELNLAWEDIEGVKINRKENIDWKNDMALNCLMITLLYAYPNHDSLFVNTFVLNKELASLQPFLTLNKQGRQISSTIWDFAFKGSPDDPLFVTGPRTRCTIKFWNENSPDCGHKYFQKEHVFTGCITSGTVKQLHDLYVQDMVLQYGIDDMDMDMDIEQDDYTLESLFVNLTLYVNHVEVFDFTAFSYKNLMLSL